MNKKIASEFAIGMVLIMALVAGGIFWLNSNKQDQQNLVKDDIKKKESSYLNNIQDNGFFFAKDGPTNSQKKDDGIWYFDKTTNKATLKINFVDLFNGEKIDENDREVYSWGKFSPNKKYISFILSSRSNYRGSIFLYDIVNNSVKKIIGNVVPDNNSGYRESLKWLADSSKFILPLATNEGRRMYLFNIDGNFKKIENQTSNAFWPKLLDDNKIVYYTDIPNGNGFGVYDLITSKNLVIDSSNSLNRTYNADFELLKNNTLIKIAHATNGADRFFNSKDGNISNVEIFDINSGKSEGFPIPSNVQISDEKNQKIEAENICFGNKLLVSLFNKKNERYESFWLTDIDSNKTTKLNMLTKGNEFYSFVDINCGNDGKSLTWFNDTAYKNKSGGTERTQISFNIESQQITERNIGNEINKRTGNRMGHLTIEFPKDYVNVESYAYSSECGKECKTKKGGFYYFDYQKNSDVVIDEDADNTHQFFVIK
jgi:hypothetical protein